MEDLKYNVTTNPGLKKGLTQKDRKDPPALQNNFNVSKEELKFNVTTNPALEGDNVKAEALKEKALHQKESDDNK